MPNQDDVRELDMPIKMGEAVFNHKDNQAIARYDRLALHGNRIAMISLVAEPSKIKAIRAMLAADKSRVDIRLTGVQAKRPSAESWERRLPKYAFADEAKYTAAAERLDYGYVHAVFISKDKNFLLGMTSERLWRSLMANYTTPLLRQWMGWLTEQMASRGLLEECSCVRCEAGWLDMPNSAPLDELVSEGLKTGQLTI